MGEKTKIELTEEEMVVFKWCWRNYDIFDMALKILKPGNLVLHLDKGGLVNKHEYHIFYKTEKSGKPLDRPVGKW